ncbi:hypothetical protein DMA15_23840 [Streptomyces sp. WAC 01529]|uniref:hypothetical protein n=1 Tax=Streptomyces sp. WAC 01529 TaxID=2203205 RepID=UPI000F6FA92B|nr:hypothetical protein [Streptomyces sp. WAC 01529]AZM55227.1 hypothetical protein DMA15_23840 [Streptomyces sp. WAC 01529]
MLEVTGVHNADEDAGSAALNRLSAALGTPAQEAAENAKALFPFIALAAAMDDDALDGAVLDGEFLDNDALEYEALGRDAMEPDALDYNALGYEESSLATLEGRPAGSAGRYSAPPGC